MISKAVELAFPSATERCFFVLRSSLFTFLWQILVNQHGLLDIPDGEHRQCTEEHQGAPVKHGIAHGKIIEDIHLVNHVVVAHGEKLSDSLYGRIHREKRIGGSTDRETDNAPERTDAHRHTQGRHQTEGKDAKTLA